MALLIFHPGQSAAAPEINGQKQIVLNKPVCDPVLAINQSEDDCFYREPKKVYPTAGYGDNCVEYAKHYIGATGVWGTGGINLPLTSKPQVGSVVVFTYAHVAVIIAISNDTLTLTESNYGYKQVTTGRQIPIGDTTIRGYYKSL